MGSTSARHTDGLLKMLLPLVTQTRCQPRFAVSPPTKSGSFGRRLEKSAGRLYQGIGRKFRGREKISLIPKDRVGMTISRALLPNESNAVRHEGKAVRHGDRVVGKGYALVRPVEKCLRTAKLTVASSRPVTREGVPAGTEELSGAGRSFSWQGKPFSGLGNSLP